MNKDDYFCFLESEIERIGKVDINLPNFENLHNYNDYQLKDNIDVNYDLSYVGILDQLEMDLDKFNSKILLKVYHEISNQIKLNLKEFEHKNISTTNYEQIYLHEAVCRLKTLPIKKQLQLFCNDYYQEAKFNSESFQRSKIVRFSFDTNSPDDFNDKIVDVEYQKDFFVDVDVDDEE
ncbi:hypothetical protein A3Q56_07734 [Intoshia linei]|uniref:Uncharacterized protein n=1 Tax=Intoshia linei TaxID=1819745 RepID=A0A177ARD5_9BILA|nr:hypothetical protein A3Q56_07734 [Intoshia linei]